MTLKCITSDADTLIHVLRQSQQALEDSATFRIKEST